MVVEFNPKKIPPPSPAFAAQATIYGQPDAKGLVNGNITATFTGYPLHQCRHPGRVRQVSFSLVGTGRDADNILSMEIDVLLNGTTVLSTLPKISYISGELTSTKTTMDSGESIIQGVLDYTNRDYNPGDVFTYNATIVRTSSPDDEMSGLCVLMEFEPNLPK